MAKRFTSDELIKILKAATLLSSQKALAKKLGTSEEHLSRVLSGKYAISDEFARKTGHRRIILFEEIA